MTGSRQPPSILRRVIAALRQEKGSSLAARLLAASERAAGTEDWQLAGLLADRLVRLGLANGEAGYCLRAAARARLGDPQGAIADVAQARLLAPDHPIILTLDMRSADPALRRSAFERALLGADEAVRQTALSDLAAAGMDAVMIAQDKGGRIAATLYWRGADALSLGCTDGEAHFSLPPLQGSRSPLPHWPYIAETALDWLERQEALAFRVEPTGEGRPMKLFQAPPILHRSAAPGPQQANPAAPAASGAARRLLILVPVHGDAAATLACLDSLFAAEAAAATTRILVIDDASPDRALVAALQRLAQDRRITLLRNPLNLGFARSVNRGLGFRRHDEDVLLLNADTLVPAGAIARLAAAVSETSIGTATPLSNNGEDTSFPLRFSVNPMPDMAGLVALDRLAQQANPGRRIDLPNGVGFCLYIRSDVLKAVGLLSTDYGRGYYEDVDFCLRAREAGFRNVCAADVVVAHHGSRSFRGEKAVLVRRNQAVLECRFPFYRKLARDYRREDPLREPLGRIEDLWLRDRPHHFHLILAPPTLPSWLVDTLLAQAESDGLHPVLARAATQKGRLDLSLTSPSGLPRNLTLHLPTAAARDPQAIGDLLGVHRWAGIRLIEPDDLPPELVAGCHLSDIAVACSAPKNWSAAFEPSPCKSGGIDDPDLPARPLDDFSLKAPRATCRELSLILDGDTVSEQGLVAELARCEPEIALALLGSAAGAGASDAPNLWPVAPIAREEIGGWLRQAGINACLVTSRRYGLADPNLGDWLASGLHVAVFDGALSEPRREGRCLRLPGAMPDADVARQISDWLDRAPSPQG